MSFRIVATSCLLLVACRSSQGVEQQSALATQRSALVQPQSAQTIAAAASSAGPRTRPNSATPTRAELGRPAPAFRLLDLDGREHALEEQRGRVVVVEWIDPLCPYVAHAYSKGPLRAMHAYAEQGGVAWFSIYSGPAADVEGLRELHTRLRITDPILLDSDGYVARLFGARVTPQMFVINAEGELVYRGALDNAPLGRVEDGGARINYVEAALADLRAGHAVITRSAKPHGTPIRFAAP
jgi:hypothetical protein